MKDILVNKQDLLKILKENRETHVIEYNDMCKTYFEKVLIELNALKRSANAKKFVSYYVNLSAPESHEEDYDSIIGLLELSTNELIELDMQSYNKYVLDKWDWQRSFAMSKTAYLQ